MPQRLLTIAGLLVGLSVAGSASAQVFVRPVSMVVGAPAAVPAHGRVSGTVQDTAGRAIDGVSVVAVGATLVAARSDRFGRFVLALPPGDYVLRAARDGYLSTLREPIRVRSRARLERDITLVQQDPGAVAATPVEPTHGHTTMAWILRHLRRSVLRDATEAAGLAGRGAAADRSAAPSALLLATGLEGQVNVLTRGSLDAAGDWSTGRWSGQVAYVAVGAPVGAHGKWTVRAGVTSGEPSSWTVLGEYHVNDDSRHAFTAGVSYATQQVGAAGGLFQPNLVSDRRAAGALYASDRWLVSPRVEVDYDLRFERYDYLADPSLFSPRIGLRVAAPARTWIVARVGRELAAPGAGEFRPPVTDGLWMPTERSFSAFDVGRPLDAERVRKVEVGLDHDLGGSRQARTVSVRYFRQSISRQTTTLFGIARADASHYLVGTAGSVELDGFSVGVGGDLLPHLRGRVDYSVSEAAWLGAGASRALRAAAPSAGRRGDERLHDVAASLDAAFPATSTNVSMAYRLSSGFSESAEAPGLGGRFAVEVRQALPYQPLRDGRLDLVVGVRNLFRDLDAVTSMYDELLTVAPPLRFVGGVQIRF